MNPVALEKPSLPLPLLEAFSARLARNSRVFCLDGELAKWFSLRGFEAQAVDPGKDLRWLSLKRDSYDGIWADTGFDRFTIEDAQRVVAAFFQALHPGIGIVQITHPYDRDGFASMLRQNGFQILRQGILPAWTAVLAQRI